MARAGMARRVVALFSWPRLSWICVGKRERKRERKNERKNERKKERWKWVRNIDEID